MITRPAQPRVFALGLLTVELVLGGLVLGCNTQNDDGDVGDGPDYAFVTDDPTTYERIDRNAMPALGAVVITDSHAYNQANPAADVAGQFVSEITANVEALHTALDDDLTGLGLTPCAIDVCIAQAAPFVVPDTLKLDFAADSGFPNGRRLDDPVIDLTLALILLDLSVDGQELSSLVGALNPEANDLPFESAFPYLAFAHQP